VKQRRSARRYLPAAERKSHLLDVAVALIRDQGWDQLTIANVAKRAGVSRQLVHQYFRGPEQLGLELAERFHDEIYNVAVAAIAHHLDDYAAAIRELLEAFLIGLREERFVYLDFVSGHRQHPQLRSPLKQIYARNRRRLIDVWARYFERVCGLAPRRARLLASLQFNSIRGVQAMVDAADLEAEEAISLLIEIIGAAIDRLGGTTLASGVVVDRGGET
jgi:AcrR family transcriptional regulator